MKNQSPVAALNALLADIFALYLKTKNFHWHVQGPHFRDYHLLFDEQSGELFAMTDVIAERVRKLGGKTLRSLGDITRHQRIADCDQTDMTAQAMASMLHDDNQSLLKSLKELKTIVDEAGDNATSGEVDQWTDQAERRIWFLGRIIAP